MSKQNSKLRSTSTKAPLSHKRTPQNDIRSEQSSALLTQRTTVRDVHKVEGICGFQQ